MSFNLNNFPHMILDDRVQDKMSCFDTCVPEIQHFFIGQCPMSMAILIPEQVYRHVAFNRFYLFWSFFCQQLSDQY